GAGGGAWGVVGAGGGMSDALVELVESLGILPTTKLQVAAIPERSFDPDSTESLEDLIARALVQRPDLVARLSKVRASRAAVKGAQGGYYPQFGLEWDVGGLDLQESAAGASYFWGEHAVRCAGSLVVRPVFGGLCPC